MLFDLGSAADALEDLLDLERRMILDGKLDGLARATPQKSQLIARLADVPDLAPLQRLRQKAERNQELLRAATLGLAAATTQLARMSSGGAPLRTYGPDGSASDLGKPVPLKSINHRA
jgi:flagellar biosynthesis/type III secretory pathway chaperone